MRSKYSAIKTVVNGITFASRKEAKRYSELILLEKAKVISNLQLQPLFKIEVNGIKICTYKADFSYIENGKQIIEDCKGFKTPVYRLKCKLMLAVHGISILET